MNDNGYYFEYIMNFYDEEEECESTRCGVVFAESYGSAMTYLSEYYGEDCIIEVKKLFAVFEGRVYEFEGPETSLKLNENYKEDI